MKETKTIQNYKSFKSLSLQEKPNSENSGIIHVMKPATPQKFARKTLISPLSNRQHRDADALTNENYPTIQTFNSSTSGT